jgi:hypothetical protein
MTAEATMANTSGKGWFKRGNTMSVGKGRPRKVLTYQEAAVAAVGRARWRKVIAKVCEQALGGDLRASALLVKLVCGDAPAEQAALAAQLRAEVKRYEVANQGNLRVAGAGTNGRPAAG